MASDNPLFGRLFAGPVKDDHVWVLLRELNHHLIWVADKTFILGFWALDAEGAQQWRTVPFNSNSLKQFFAEGTIRQEDIGLEPMCILRSTLRRGRYFCTTRAEVGHLHHLISPSGPEMSRYLPRRVVMELGGRHAGGVLNRDVIAHAHRISGVDLARRSPSFTDLTQKCTQKKTDKFAKRTDYDCQCLFRGEATHFLLFRLSPGIQTDRTIKKVQ